MKNKINLLLFVFLACAFPSFALVATPDMGPVYYGIRHNGMGNVSVAVVDDRYSLFNNPAGLDLFREHVELSICPFLLHLDQKFYDIASFLLKNEKELKNPDLYTNEFFNDFSKIDAKWAKLGFFPEATFTTRHFGFGAYNVLSTSVSAETGHFIPKLGLGGNEDFVLTAGYANRIQKLFSVGIAFKYIYRVVLPDTIFGFTDTYKASRELKGGIAGGNLAAFMTWARLERGIGFDFGGMMHLGSTRIGVTAQDVGEYLEGEFKRVRFSAGVSHRFLPIMEIPFVDEFLVALDVKDVLRPKDSFFNKVYFGTELDMHMLALRGGFSQGYPTFGASLNFSILCLEYAYTTEEWGYYPGQFPVSAHLLSARLGIKF